jgi:hypothetical protein
MMARLEVVSGCMTIKVKKWSDQHKKLTRKWKPLLKKD